MIETKHEFTEADAGKRIAFPHTGSVYGIVAVNEAMETVTFEVIGDPEDRTTESFEDLAAVDEHPSGPWHESAPLPFSWQFARRVKRWINRLRWGCECPRSARREPGGDT